MSKSSRKHGRKYVNLLPDLEESVEAFAVENNCRTFNDAVNRMVALANKYLLAVEAEKRNRQAS